MYFDFPTVAGGNPGNNDAGFLGDLGTGLHTGDRIPCT